MNKMANEICQNSSASRLRGDATHIFDIFLIVSQPSNSKTDTSIDFQFPKEGCNEDVLKQCLMFCFPFSAKTSFSELRDSHFSFILSDIEGKHQFGFCKLVPSCWKCYCILSFMPWFEIFYKILNYAHELSSTSQKKLLQAMLDNLYYQSVPLPLQKFELNQMISVQAPDNTALPSVPENRNLSEYIAAVNKVFMLDVFASMMFERRIIFTSSSLSVLTSCVHAAEALLRPLHWQHIFVSVMPPHLLDYLLAPMPYFVGVHASLMRDARDMIDDDVIIADVDSGEIETVHSDVQLLPSDSVLFLKSLFRKSTILQGNSLPLAFLRMQARLIGGYRTGLKFHEGEPITFDEDAFVGSCKSGTTREFARSLVQLQTFKQFVDGRLELLNGGVGFGDRFENEVDDVRKSTDNRDSYKEWMAVARKGGNDFFHQVKKKAKENMKGAKHGFQKARMKHQHSVQQPPHRTLEENPQRIRPYRPTSQTTEPDGGEPTDRLRPGTKPPRPPNPTQLPRARTRPPRPPPPHLKQQQQQSLPDTTCKRTRKYKPLDLDLESGSDFVMTSIHNDTMKQRTMSDAFDRVDVDILADLVVGHQWSVDCMSAVSVMKSSPAKSNNNQPQLLIDLSEDADVAPAAQPLFQTPAVTEQSDKNKPRTSQHHTDLTSTKPTTPLNTTLQFDTHYSSDDLRTSSPTPFVDLVQLSENKVILGTQMMNEPPSTVDNWAIFNSLAEAENCEQKASDNATGSYAAELMNGFSAHPVAQDQGFEDSFCSPNLPKQAMIAVTSLPPLTPAISITDTSQKPVLPDFGVNKHPPSRSPAVVNETEMFSDLLGIWKNREQL